MSNEEIIAEMKKRVDENNDFTTLDWWLWFERYLPEALDKARAEGVNASLNDKLTHAYDYRFEQGVIAGANAEQIKQLAKKNEQVRKLKEYAKEFEGIVNLYHFDCILQRKIDEIFTDCVEKDKA